MYVVPIFVPTLKLPMCYEFASVRRNAFEGSEDTRAALAFLQVTSKTKVRVLF